MNRRIGACALFGPLVTLLCLQPAMARAAEPAPDAPPEAERNYRKGVLIEVEGPILPMLEKYLERKLEQSRQLEADLVILEIDSPGGAIETTFNLVATLRDISWAHTVAFVPDEALSGAAILSLACDEIIMAPRARMGDAGPIVQGPDALFRHAPEKIRSDLARRIRDLAGATGRPPALAEAMVDMDLTVYRVTHRESGEVTYMSQAELDSLENPAVWEKGPPVLESREDTFLEVNGERAVELQLADGNAESREELKERYALAEPRLIILEQTALDVAIDTLNHPLVTGLVFVIGAVALYMELSAPGIGAGGLISGLCFTLFFWSRFLGGTSGWLEVILVVSGVVFLAMEIFVIPGFGIAGISGLLLVIVGIVMASQNHLIPQSPRAMSHLGNSLLVLATSGVVSLAVALIIGRFYRTIPVLNRLVLTTPDHNAQVETSPEGKPLPKSPRIQAGVGDWGVADCPLRPAGKAVFGDEYLDVVTDGSFVDQGSQVKIIAISGNRIVVREVKS